MRLKKKLRKMSHLFEVHALTKPDDVSMATTENNLKMYQL